MIGISSLATDHLILSKLVAALREFGLGHIGVVVGGIVRDEETELLTSAGVAYILHSGARRDHIVSKIAGLAVAARAMEN